MNTNTFLSKLTNYLENQSTFLSTENLNHCFNRFVSKNFNRTSRVVCSENAEACIDMFSEEELALAILFAERGTLLESLSIEEESIINRYTFNNFKQKSISLFTNTGIVIRGARYV